MKRAHAMSSGLVGRKIAPRQVCENLGGALIGRCRALAQLVGFGFSVLVHAATPGTWRRTVREEFIDQCHRAGVRALPAVCVTAVLIGIAMVFQFVYWLSIFGQEDIVGTIVVLTIVREIAPLLVAVIAVGRSGTVMAVELDTMRGSGQVHVLESHGIDPFIYLVVPRVLALALCVFCLTVTFIVVALSAGYIMVSVLGVSTESPLQFINGVLGAMGPADYILIPLKTLLIGYFIGLITCTIPLASERSKSGPGHLLPRTFMVCMLAILIISATLSLLL